MPLGLLREAVENPEEMPRILARPRSLYQSILAVGHLLDSLHDSLLIILLWRLLLCKWVQTSANKFGQLHDYKPPKWASSLKNSPRNFVKVR